MQGDKAFSRDADQRPVDHGALSRPTWCGVGGHDGVRRRNVHHCEAARP
jgi:hypothetical protein